MLTAEYGGSGGKPIESGLVVEEPDIEIGAGVSSKGKFFSLLPTRDPSGNGSLSYQQTYGDRQRRPAGTSLDPRQPVRRRRIPIPPTRRTRS